MTVSDTATIAAPLDAANRRRAWEGCALACGMGLSELTTLTGFERDTGGAGAKASVETAVPVGSASEFGRIVPVRNGLLDLHSPSKGAARSIGCQYVGLISWGLPSFPTQALS